jgi:hypothetical protein
MFECSYDAELTSDHKIRLPQAESKSGNQRAACHHSFWHGTFRGAVGGTQALATVTFCTYFRNQIVIPA